MTTPELVVIGCSAGGLQALQVVLAGIAPGLHVPVVIVTHTASTDIAVLCELLAQRSSLPVQEAVERQIPQPGKVYVAPSGYHLLISENIRRFELSLDAKVCFVRPSIDVLFESAADAYRNRLLGVILTGANHDGAAGLRRIRNVGGLAIVQDPADAEAPAMPSAALAAAGADHCVGLRDIPQLINRICLR